MLRSSYWCPLWIFISSLIFRSWSVISFNEIMFTRISKSNFLRFSNELEIPDSPYFEGCWRCSKNLIRTRCAGHSKRPSIVDKGWGIAASIVFWENVFKVKNLSTGTDDVVCWFSSWNLEIISPLSRKGNLISITLYL